MSDYGNGYQMMLTGNPAFTGSEGNGTLRLSYLNLYPGNSYNLHSVYLTYDGYLPSVHGGAGFYITNDFYGGIINDLRGGASYAYYFQAGNELYISAGLTASFYHRGFSYSGLILPDQIDPLGRVINNPGELLAMQGKTVFDLGTGLLIMGKNYFAGLSVNHLTEPDLSVSEMASDRMKRRMCLIVSGDITLNGDRSLILRPFGKIDVQNGLFMAGAGSVVEIKYLSINALILTDNLKNTDLQTGFAVTKGNLMLYYNYRFNIISQYSMIPFSVLHHTGIAISLNNVDKRKIIKTINFPKL